MSAPMSTANLLYSDTEDALRDSVRRLFAARCAPETIATVYDDAHANFTDVWSTLATELGLPASTVHAMLVTAKLQPHRIRSRSAPTLILKPSYWT